MALAVLVSAAAAGARALSAPARAAPTPAASGFGLGAVSLAPGSLYGTIQARNLAFVLSLNTSQLLCDYTSAANLTACTAARCPSPGGAGRPVCAPLAGEMGLGAYYGHYLGHWLSGTAMLYANTGNTTVRARAATVVAGLAACQAAWAARYPSAAGYLFPYDIIVFRMLEGQAAYRRVYSVPFYTVHKVMAGLFDQHHHAGNEQALDVLIKLADWVVANVARTVARGGEALWQRVLGTEWCVPSRPGPKF